MSKHHTVSSRRERERKQRRITLFVVGGLVLGAVVILALVWNTLGPTPIVAGTPQVQVDTERLDLGTHPFNHPARASFVIQNTGNGTLTLNVPKSPTVLEGCCPSQIFIGQTILGPGESTTLYTDIVMHEGMGGPHLFEIPLGTNDPTQLVKKLYIASDWQPG